MGDNRAKKEVLLKLKRIEGQLPGLQRLVEEGGPCADILIQVAAATAAMKKVGMVMVQAYMNECLERGLETASGRKGDTLKDLQTAISRYIDRA